MSNEDEYRLQFAYVRKQARLAKATGSARRGAGSRKAGCVWHASACIATRKFSISNAKTREPGRTIPNPCIRAASVGGLVHFHFGFGSGGERANLISSR